MRKISTPVVILIALLFLATPVLAACPPPPPPPPPSQKYIDCNDLGSGYLFGFRIYKAQNGTYHFTNEDGSLTGGAPADQNATILISNSDSRSFDWSASLGIDAVIVQAQGKSTVRKLSEEKRGRGFQAPLNASGKPYPVERIEFCYDYELSASVTAQGTASGGATWEITKSVAAAEQSKFAGEKAAFDYTVAVHKTAGGSGSGYSVASAVKIANPTPLAATITSVKDVLRPGDVDVKLDCGVQYPYSLPAGKDLTCTADTALPGRLDGESQVVVKASGKVAGGTASAKIDWSGAPSLTGSAGPVTVTDTNTAFGGPYSVTGDQTWTYSVELACPTDPAAYTSGQQTTKLDNIAAITETGQKASQSVTLHCYAPVLSSTTNAGYDVKYTWAITKTSPTKDLTLKPAETAKVDYTVGVSIASQAETNFQLSGAITIANPNPTAPLAATLADEAAPGVPAALSDCTNPVTVPAGGTLTCAYAAAMPAKPAGTNTARLTFNNIAFTTSAPYDFNNATKNNEVDECVTVSDDSLGKLGAACADKAPATFAYSLTLGPYKECTKTSYLNQAFFVTNDTGATGDAVWEVNITVPCPPVTNCTRNAAYWLAHGNPNDASTFNATWNQIKPGGPASPFFTTGSSWIATLANNPLTNPYVPLAQDYIAVKLNMLFGSATTPSLLSTISHAEALLSQYATTQGSIAGTPAEADFNNTTSILDNYNTGLTGPGLCPDCQP